jgi:hypothetical protein
MRAHGVVRPRLVGLVMLVFLLLALLGGCAASSQSSGGSNTTGGETTSSEQASACPETTTGGETTSNEQTSACPETTSGGETTSHEQTSACPQTTSSGETTFHEQASTCPQTTSSGETTFHEQASTCSQTTGGTKQQAAGPRVTRRGSDLLRPSYVGEVYGTSAFIGIAFPGNTIPAEGPDKGMEVIVFITDGDPNQVGLRGAYGEWFRGSINKEGAIDSLESDLGVEIWGPVTERTSTGTVRFEEDAVFPYRADLVSTDNNAGLYRQEGEVEGIEYTAGWIVLPDGRIRGSSFPPNIPCCGPKECLSQTGGGK